MNPMPIGTRREAMFLRKDWYWHKRSKTQRIVVKVRDQDLVQLKALVQALDRNDAASDRLRSQIEQILAASPDSFSKANQTPWRLRPTQH
jgi:hypothetical protein